METCKLLGGNVIGEGKNITSNAFKLMRLLYRHQQGCALLKVNEAHPCTARKRIYASYKCAFLVPNNALSCVR